MRILLLLAVFCLAACGGGGDGEPGVPVGALTHAKVCNFGCKDLVKIVWNCGPSRGVFGTQPFPLPCGHCKEIIVPSFVPQSRGVRTIRLWFHFADHFLIAFPADHSGGEDLTHVDKIPLDCGLPCPDECHDDCPDVDICIVQIDFHLGSDFFCPLRRIDICAAKDGDRFHAPRYGVYHTPFANEDNPATSVNEHDPNGNQPLGTTQRFLVPCIACTGWVRVWGWGTDNFRYDLGCHFVQDGFAQIVIGQSYSDGLAFGRLFDDGNRTFTSPGPESEPYFDSYPLAYSFFTGGSPPSGKLQLPAGTLIQDGSQTIELPYGGSLSAVSDSSSQKLSGNKSFVGGEALLPSGLKAKLPAGGALLSLP